MLEDDLNQSLYRIANEPMRPWPFPHFFVRDVFTPEVYRKIHALWPAPESFQTYKDVNNIEKERFYFQFEPGRIAKLPPEQRIFWERMRAWLTRPALRRLALGKYGSEMDARLMEVFEEPVTVDEVGCCLKYGLSLVWDIRGYHLLPHADDPRVLINFLFYLPRDEEASAYGTSLYLPKQTDFRSQGEPRLPRDAFEHLWTFPFVPNAMFSFMRTPTSFHGVEPVRAENTERRLLLYSVRVDEEATARWREERRQVSLRAPVLEAVR